MRDRKKERSIKICKTCTKEYLPESNHSKYCSSLCGQHNYYNKNMLNPEWRLNKLVSMAKNRANTKELNFDIDTDHMVSLWNDGVCSITGIPFVLERPAKGKVHPYTPSIDRIVPALGYVKGNVRLVVYQMNVALSEFGLAQFEEFVKLYMQQGVQFR